MGRPFGGCGNVVGTPVSYPSDAIRERPWCQIPLCRCPSCRRGSQARRAERSACRRGSQACRAGARDADVIRRRVVRCARPIARARVLGVIPSNVSSCRCDCVRRVIPTNARRAGVIACWCGSAERPLCRVVPCRSGARGLVATRHDGPARRTYRCSRPLRARDRCFFDTVAMARSRRLNSTVGPLYECSSKPTVVVTRCFGRCGTFCRISAS